MSVAAPHRDTHLTRGELWVLGWLEGQGYSPDVLTDVDFRDDGCDPAVKRTDRSGPTRPGRG